jgi:diguanylate cyclase (GGDEF)-like protein/PAS domain S-box-containing protein
MPGFIDALLHPAGLTPHGYCLFWQRGLLWLHAISDGVTALAYFSIPVALLRFAYLRPGITYGWLLYLFSAFIVACGTTHLFDIVTLWVPAYWLSGAAKAITAVLSIITAVLLWPLIPYAVAVPSPKELQVANNALRASQGLLKRVSEVAGVGGWEMELGSNRVLWSDQARKLFGLPDGLPCDLDAAMQYSGTAARTQLRQAIDRGIAEGAPIDLELPVRTASGRDFWAKVDAAAEFENGKPVRVVGAMQDVSEQKRIEQELADQRALLQVTLEAIGAAVGDAVITADLTGRVCWLNGVAEELTGWPREIALDQQIENVFHAIGEQSRTACDNPLRACIASGNSTARSEDKLIVARDMTERSIEDSAAPICNLRGALIGAVLVFRDISERRRLHAEMSHRATHDDLTGLRNRTDFEARLTHLLARAGQDGSTHAVLYIDIDQFKIINDTSGHAVGDLMLKQVASLLQASVRADDIVARLGGDEFGIILEGCGLDPAARVAQSICQGMEAFRFVHDTQRFPVCASIGLVQMDAGWASAGAVMQAADAACFEAKDAGRNRVYVWREDDYATAARNKDMHWINRLDQALDEDRFELFGQLIEPVRADPAERHATGLHAEVLLRLREPGGTIVPPGVFIPAAERFHMATRIDRWVVQHVFAWLEQAEARQEHIGMLAVNLSGQSIGDRAFHHQVSQMIRQAKFDPSRLCFEITETAAITSIRDAASFIDEVRALGVKIALDDFGAGASSFSHLKTLSVDFLKIDGHFIVDMLEDEMDRAAVRCFRDVARARGVKTIAECVERPDVRDALADLGIDMVQGYLIHRPEPLANLFALQPAT